MKRASKILTLILIAVFVLSVFAGCDLVGRNTSKYRSTTAMQVGEQQITIGKLLDTFNSYYNSYYYYVSAGYLTSDSLLEMVISSLQQQYIQIDDYVKTHKAVRANPEVHNAEYLTAEQFEYCIKYVKHASFTAFDDSVMTTLSVKHDIGDAKEDDTSRDFTEYDELLSDTSYAEHLLKQNFVSEDADEYFEKYYSGVELNFADINKLSEGYVYKTKEDAKAILDELNDRLEDDSDEITFEEYADAQEKAVKQYRDSVKNNYDITLEEFMKGQVADMVSSSILALWRYEQYKDIDVAETVDNVNKVKFEEQQAQFELNGDFDAFITKLSDSSFIYNVPEDMQGKYVFVKNILIPFADEQSSWLSAQSDSYGGTDTEAYKKLRDRTAAKIEAEYFYSDKYEASVEELFSNFLVENTDEEVDRKYDMIANIFTNDSGKLAINPNGVLGSFFAADGTVNPMTGKSEAETVVELMKRFNTDTAQHSSRYDYVVYVGDDWKDYSHSWVEEFYTAVNQLLRDGEDEGELNTAYVGKKYAMCVSTYGVHIIYVDSFVEQHVYNYEGIDWTAASSWNDTSSLNYVRYKAEFDNKINDATSKAYEALQKKYLEDSNLVSVNKQFARFLKDNDFTFDFDEFKEEILEELK